MKNRTEIISFKNYNSLNEIFDSFDDSNTLRKKCDSAFKIVEDFHLTLKNKNTQQYIKCRGRTVIDQNNAAQGILLIFEDISEMLIINTKAQIQQENILASKQYYIDILDSLPYLIWIYDKNAELQYANKAYHDLFNDRSIIINDDFPYKHVSINGVSKSLLMHQVNEINYAHDITELSDIKQERKILYETQRSITASLNIPIAFYDKQQKLKLYNNAFINLWQLDKKWLNQGPSYDEICHKLLAEEKIVAGSILQSFTDVIKAQRKITSLCNGEQIYVNIIPSADHSLWFIYEYIIK